MNKVLISLSALFVLFFSGCENKLAKFAEEEMNRCIADELNRIKKPFAEDIISQVKSECGTYVNELMRDMQPGMGE